MPDNPLAADLDHILAHSQGLWEELRGQRVFITGGTGFFGCWLLESLVWANRRLNLGASALVLTRDAESFARKAPHLAADRAIQFHVGDVRSFDFPDGEFSHVLHLATEGNAQANSEDPLRAFEITVLGVRRALEFARCRAARKFLFTSSGSVYGRQPEGLGRLPEDYLGGPDPTDSQSAYGIGGEAKRSAEALCAIFAKQFGLKTMIARCFAFVGPHLPLEEKFAIGNFIRDALRGGPIRVNGDGTPFRSYLYAADLVIWLWTILLRGQSGRAYNVGSDADLTIAQLARLVAEAVNPGAEVIIARPSDPAKPPQRYVPSIDRARKELGLDPWVPLREGLRRMADWQRMVSSDQERKQISSPEI